MAVPGGEGHCGQLIKIESLSPDRSDRPERYHHIIILLCYRSARTDISLPPEGEGIHLEALECTNPDGADIPARSIKRKE